MNLFPYKETHFFNFIQFPSFIAQLCNLVAHPVGTRKLITQEVLPLLRISSSSKADIDPKESQSIATLNGMTPQVGEWVGALTQLVLREGLQFLSMLTWSNIADQRGVVRSTRAWCPACYDEWQRTGQEMYEPLLWNVKAVTRCPYHHQDLLDRYPQQECHRHIPLVAGLSSPDHCPRCGSSLAIPVAMETARESFTDGQDGDIQQWIANAATVKKQKTGGTELPADQEAPTQGKASQQSRSKQKKGRVGQRKEKRDPVENGQKSYVVETKEDELAS